MAGSAINILAAIDPKKRSVDKVVDDAFADIL